MAALIDFSCNLLTNSSPDISLSLSSHSPSIKAQSGTGWAAVKGQTIYQPVSSCCLLFQPDRLCGSPRPNNSDWLRRAPALHDTNTHIVYIYIYTLTHFLEIIKGYKIDILRWLEDTENIYVSELTSSQVDSTVCSQTHLIVTVIMLTEWLMC